MPGASHQTTVIITHISRFVNNMIFVARIREENYIKTKPLLRIKWSAYPVDTVNSPGSEI